MVSGLACRSSCGAQAETAACQDKLGSISFLSPVRASKATRAMLGANDKVLTPVRRSARKGTSAGLGNTGAKVQDPVAALLEETAYCYKPNELLPSRQLDFGSSE
ncbi:MAG: hypothetical protein WDW38_008345 [Sanguina aurantia]